MLIKRRKTHLLLYEKSIVLHSNKLEFPSPKDALCQVWLKLAQWFWRGRFLNFINVFSLFPNKLPMGKGRALHLNKLEFPSPKDALCHVWLKLAQWFWRRRFFNFVNVFLIFCNYLPLEKDGALSSGELKKTLILGVKLSSKVGYFARDLPYGTGALLYLGSAKRGPFLWEPWSFSTNHTTITQ